MRLLFVRLLKFVLALAMAVVAVAVQVNLVPLLPFGLWHVDLLVVAVTYWTLTRGVPPILPWAVGAGLLADVFSPSGFGVRVITLLAVIGVVSACARHLVTNHTKLAWLSLSALGAAVGGVAPPLIEWVMQVLHFTAWRGSGLMTGQTLAAIMVSVAAQLGILMGLFVWQRRVGEWTVRR